MGGCGGGTRLLLLGENVSFGRFDRAGEMRSVYRSHSGRGL